MSEQRSFRGFGYWALLLLCVSAVGCSHDKSPAKPSGKQELRTTPLFDSGMDITNLPGNKFEATYSENTVVFDPAAVRKILRGASAKQGVFILDGSSEQARKLAPGSIMFLQGLTMRKVLAVATDGPNLVIGTETEEAPLTEVIKDGQIQMNLPINFLQVQADKRKRAALQRYGDPASYPSFPEFWARLNPVVHAGSGEGEEESGSDTDEDWHFTFKAKPSLERLNFEITGKKDFIQAIDANMLATGYVDNFREALSIVIQNNNLHEYTFKASDIDGEVVFHWAVYRRGEKKPATGEDEEKHIKLPKMLKLPFMVGPLPLTFELGGALLIKPGFSASNEVAGGTFKVKFNGAGGIHLGTGDQLENDSDSNVGSEPSIENGSAVGPAGLAVVVAVAAPRAELKTGLEPALDNLEEALPYWAKESALKALEKSTIGDWVKKKAKEMAVEKVKDKLKAEGVAYFQVVISSSALTAGMLSMVPCQRYILLASGRFGAEVAALGKSKEFAPAAPLFEKKIEINEPPGKACSQ